SGGSAVVGSTIVHAGATATIGGGTVLATFTFNGMTADNLTVADKGKASQLVVGTPAARDNSVTNRVAALSVTGSGQVDIGHPDLRLDSTRTPDSVSRAYWRAGYN